jgi:DNA polymerase IV
MKEMYPKNGRVILHIDCNAFFASVEAAYCPSLRDKPLAVAGNPKERRGIILTCNYLAREKGVYTTMSLWEAKKKCPDLVVRPPNFDLYREMSAKIFDFLSNFSPLLEPASIDEGYMDITDCYEMGTPLEIANRIQKGLLDTYQIPVSIGIAPNKFLAKMASNMRKPLGITVLRKRDVPNILWPLPVQKMHGVGEKTARKLHEIGIYTIGDLAKAQEGLLKNTLGINGVYLRERANGVDHHPVDPNAAAEIKSIGNSTTLPHNVIDEQTLVETLEKLTRSVCERMKQKSVVTKNIQITIRYSDFHTVTRSKKLENPAIHMKDIFHHVVQLFKKHWTGDPVRLLGVTALDVVDRKHAVKQLDLFSYEEDAKREPLFQAIEQLVEKYGDTVIQRGFEWRKKR